MQKLEAYNFKKVYADINKMIKNWRWHIVGITQKNKINVSKLVEMLNNKHTSQGDCNKRQKILTRLNKGQKIGQNKKTLTLEKLYCDIFISKQET